MSYQYGAVTMSTPDMCTDMLRIDDEGIIEQYDTGIKNWRLADSEMYGIYIGKVEVEPISKAKTGDNTAVAKKCSIKRFLRH